MSKEFYTQTLSTKYDFDEFYIGCEKKVKLFFKDKIAILEGFGESYQEKQDPYDDILGKGFALTRANKDIDNQIENWLIKYSCTNNMNWYKDVSITIDNCTTDKDILDLLLEKPQGKELKDLVGKWVVRTKSLRTINNNQIDRSYQNEPIFIVAASSNYAKFKFKKPHCVTFEFNKGDWDDYYLDNNWIEYKKGTK